MCQMSASFEVFFGSSRPFFSSKQEAGDAWCSVCFKKALVTDLSTVPLLGEDRLLSVQSGWTHFTPGDQLPARVFADLRTLRELGGCCPKAKSILNHSAVIPKPVRSVLLPRSIKAVIS